MASFLKKLDKLAKDVDKSITAKTKHLDADAKAKLSGVDDAQKKFCEDSNKQAADALEANKGNKKSDDNAEKTEKKPEETKDVPAASTPAAADTTTTEAAPVDATPAASAPPADEPKTE
mmetsp:Transcript_18902/g.32633  ORF Transcript_18902/g.32633 Transcript_18902/m.32633 type:complete len:119 (+) Transcript_18902:88-444(+)